MKKLLVGIGLVLQVSCIHPSPQPPIPVPPNPIPPVEVSLPALKAHNTHFHLVDDSRITIRGVTDFALYKRYLDGEDINPILIDRNGFNLHRVFFTAKNLFDLDPRNYLLYYEKLVPFAKLLALHNRYIEVVIFADAPLIFSNEQEQLDHYNKLIEKLHDQTNVIFELVNENDQNANRINTSAFPCHPELIYSSGSNGSQAIPVRPWCTYETFHTNDAPEWWRKGGHNGMELSAGAEELPASGVPVINNEKTRWPDRDSNLFHTADDAAASVLLIAGSTFHCIGCRISNLFTEDEKMGVAAFLNGTGYVPLECQEGGYRRRDDLLDDTLLRVYQRGNNDACIVKIRK